MSLVQPFLRMVRTAAMLPYSTAVLQTPASLSRLALASNGGVVPSLLRLQATLTTSSFSHPLPSLTVKDGTELEVTRVLINTIVSEVQDDIPRALPLIGLLKNALRGCVLCKLHADSWPQFNTLVCEVFHPRVSEVADLLCYSRGSREDVLQLLLSNSLVSWGRRQQIYHVESELSEYLCENLRDPSSGRRVLASSLEAVVGYLPNFNSEESKREMPCPDGFVLGCLEVHHTPLIISHWKKFRDWRLGDSFIKSLITDFDTKALYTADNLDVPVAWVLQYPFGRMGGVRTSEIYRGKDFGTFLTAHLSKSIAGNGIMPEALCEVGNLASRRLLAKLGFVEGGYRLNWLVLET